MAVMNCLHLRPRREKSDSNIINNVKNEIFETLITNTHTHEHILDRFAHKRAHQKNENEVKSGNLDHDVGDEDDENDEYAPRCFEQPQ